jgi:3-ketoacyl-CoA synthase
MRYLTCHSVTFAGGRGIIDGLEKELKLTRPQVEPSRASLFRFGNTSSTR